MPPTAQAAEEAEMLTYMDEVEQEEEEPESSYAPIHPVPGTESWTSPTTNRS